MGNPGKIRAPYSWRSMALVLALVALACLPKLGNAFVWDDLPLIVESDFIHNFANLPRAFLHDSMYAADGGKFQAQAGLDTYRPVTVVSFFLDAAFSQRNPIAYHVDNLIVHLLCTALVMVFATRWLSESYRRLAPWAALWFGLHPTLGEAHLWINGRSDLWCTFFGLSALCLWWRDPTRDARSSSWLRLIAVYALCLLGLLSKETLAPALLVALVWDLGFFHLGISDLRITRVWLVRSAPILVSLTTYLLLRVAALQGVHASQGAAQVWQALSYLPLVIQDGFAAAIAPTQLMPRYLLEEYSGATVWQQAVALSVFVALAGASLWFRVRWPQGSFGLVWFAVVLAPASMIATLAWYGFGRYLYLPFAVLLPALAEGGSRLTHYVSGHSPRLARFGTPIALLALFVLGVRLALSAPQWNGSEAFYTAIIAEAPQASHGLGGMGKLLVEQGRPAEAIPLLERAVLRNRSDHRYLNNLAVSYLRTGRHRDALRAVAVGAERFPTQAKFPFVRALVLVNNGSPDEVAVALAQTFEIDVSYAPARFLVNELCTLHPRRSEYRSAMERVFSAHPKLRTASLLPQ